MALGSNSLRSARLAVAVVLILVPTLLVAADRPTKKPKFGQYNPADATVEMFAAIEKGQIDVKVIPKDSTESRVIIENKSDKPLNVKLPAAFAGVPVLAQGALGGGGFGGGGLGGGRNNRSGGGNQSIGGGMMGGGMMGGGMMGGGGGMFNVPPEKVGKFKVAAVCLEHGKKEPRPNIPYQVKPISEFTDNPAVHQLCEMLGTGKINQRAAQVAAWHLSDGMSFQELAGKQLRSANGMSRPYFSAQEIKAGMQISAMAVQLAEKEKKSPGETNAVSMR